MIEKKKKAILVAPLNSSFVKTDISILSIEYEVKVFIVGNHKGIYYLIRLFKFCIFLLINLYKTKLYYSWFADYHSFILTIFSKIFNIKTIVCVGGYDAVYLKEFKYGILNNTLRGMISKITVKLSDKVFFSSNFLKLTYQKNEDFRNDSKYHVIYPAFEEPFLVPNTNSKKIQFICISYCNDIHRAHIKGIDRFLSLAKIFNDYDFVLVGVSQKFMNDDIFKGISNLKIYNELSRNMIFKLLNESLFICQLSRFEAFGLAVLEGIYFKCIPIIANDTGLVEMVTDLPLTIFIEQSDVLNDYEPKIIQLINDFKNFEIDFKSNFNTEGFSKKSRTNKVLCRLFSN